MVTINVSHMLLGERMVFMGKIQRKHPPYFLLEGYARLAGYSLDDIAVQLHITRRTLDHKISGISDFMVSEVKTLERLLFQRGEVIFLTSEVS